MNAIETLEHAGKTIRIFQDEEADSPRDWCNLGTMVCFHRRYTLGDKHNFSSPEDFREWWKDNGKGGIILPLHLYDHSRITMSCSAFSCQWDSGQVGWIYATRETIAKEFSVKRLSKSIRESAEKCLREEVETFDQYITGQVYGYVIENSADDYGDSCWGFFGLDCCIQEAKSIADSIARRELDDCCADILESARAD